MVIPPLVIFLRSLGDLFGEKLNGIGIISAITIYIIALVLWFKSKEIYDTDIIIRSFMDICKDSHLRELEVRVTLWVPKDKKNLEQIIPYCPTGGGAGRVINNTKGIIGKAYRTKTTILDVLNKETTSTSESFQKYMIDKYGFSSEEVIRLAQDRKLYYALPLKDKEEVAGVVYLDSRKTDIHIYNLIDNILKSRYFIRALLERKK